jgi:uncharacterized protein
MQQHRQTRQQLKATLMRMVPMKRLITASLSVMLLAGCYTAGNSNAKTSAAPICEVGKTKGMSEDHLEQIGLCIKTAKTTYSYTVELARSFQEQEKGLMFRPTLADDKGMLFPYKEIQTLSFWMKNTVIPLDIVFIRADGSIESIAKNAVPYSLEPLSSGEPVAAVLELRGGLTTELGIGKGDIVRWK